MRWFNLLLFLSPIQDEAPPEKPHFTCSVDQEIVPHVVRCTDQYGQESIIV